MPITASQRQLFVIPDDVTYLNAAYFTPQLRRRRAAGIAALDRADAPWTIRSVDFFAPVERLRERFAELIGADAEGVAIVPSVSYGVGTAIANLKVGPGQTVVVLAGEFPSAVYPWRALVQGGDGDIVTVTRPEGERWVRPVLDAIDERTAVVAVPNCHWTDGSFLDLVEVGQAARAHGAALVVDASQSLGAVPFDTSVVRPDFLVAAGYKWLLGPYALNYLWVAPEYRAGTPLEQTWIGRAGSEDFAGLVDYNDEFAPGARRFDFGERASFHLVPMAIAALDQILEWGVGGVATALEGLTGAVDRLATERGLSPVPKHARAPHLIGVRVRDGIAPSLAGALAEQRIFVSARGDSIRVSPHLYNDQGDVERLFAALDRLL